jgi:hypothetical protein
MFASEASPHKLNLTTPASKEKEMNQSMSIFEQPCKRFQLSFRSLFNSGRGFAFPCDELGDVDIAHMGERARNNYLFARAMVGRDFCPPAVELVASRF